MSAIAITIDLLTRDAAVKAITTTKRIFPIEAVQGTTEPYLTVNRISNRDTALIDSAGNYFLTRIQVDSIAQSATTVEQLGEAVITTLNGVIKQTVKGFKDVDILLADVDFTEPNDNRTAFRRVTQFMVRWRR